ncbi:hypothetical protein BJ912DRAFT_930425 [Pholiota molesta]|nr:hypothetical protein BJ912DRAFT_930425 [Pholiota molesta]
MGRGVRKLVTLYDGLSSILDEADRRNIEGPNIVEPDPQRKRARDRMYRAYPLFLQLVPYLKTVILEKPIKELNAFIADLQEGANSARSDDIKRVKEEVYARINKEYRPAVPLERSTRDNRGLQHDILDLYLDLTQKWRIIWSTTWKFNSAIERILESASALMQKVSTSRPAPSQLPNIVSKNVTTICPLRRDKVVIMRSEKRYYIGQYYKSQVSKRFLGYLFAFSYPLKPTYSLPSWENALIGESSTHKSLTELSATHWNAIQLTKAVLAKAPALKIRIPGGKMVKTA